MRLQISLYDGDMTKLADEIANISIYRQYYYSVLRYYAMRMRL